MATNLWLSAWSDDPFVNGTQQNTAMRMGVYATFGFVQSEYVFCMNQHLHRVYLKLEYLSFISQNYIHVFSYRCMK